MPTTTPRSVLVIGATGRIGQAVLRALLTRAPEVSAHAFARTPSKLPADIAPALAGVHTGDGTDAAAVQQALAAAEATDAVLCTGVPGGLAATDVRAATGRALAEAVTVRRAADGADTRVVVVSALGAGGSTIHFGMGVGSLVAAVIGAQLRDHDEQERVLQEAFQHAPDHLLIARPVGLTDGAGSGGVRVHDGSRSVSLTVQRADLAEWIVKQICDDGDWFGKTPAVFS